ncbi:AbrB/MazE/SpoVT family DNA-binding domain-containing protein [Polynucleobacter sp. HIN7]|uniref:AbrB/MazE/SpoVT family DNA-binding domain-containing protein n=1 Tax=Polynucleobacter sp. HIN7 TaxID=3047866 RepID=UPI0025727AB4|nr:AbrB/MazE/SpoVT family DNA-binding domain-containing protein [Polynucleobacter sp. HIN7]BEI36641.1 type II toxin-antitoxin system antitoxin VapB2 [Polynucleobacter sp. HIN7]
MPIVITTIIDENGNQVIPLIGDACYPEALKRVVIRIHGNERIITPIEHTWDNFFLNGPVVSDDFMN